MFIQVCLSFLFFHQKYIVFKLTILEIRVRMCFLYVYLREREGGFFFNLFQNKEDVKINKTLKRAPKKEWSSFF